ncbi:MAG: pyrroline-5-carboxylate reductase [Flavobacteriales bacterium]|nr:pyrroline-5-carboxylate reductase [Flavobacteriales bacterium]
MYLCCLKHGKVNKKIAIIGSGNLGTSLVKGLVESGQYNYSDFILTRRNLSKLQELQELGAELESNNSEAVKKAKIVVLAVLPQKINEVLNELKESLHSEHLIISLVSGVKVKNIQDIIGTNIPIVRAMPNTAIAIRESMTCIATSEPFKIHIPEVEEIFKLVGETIVIIEEQMTSATALCACGIAFFLRAIRAASQGGNEIDFHANEALKMAAQTAKGAASLLLANNSHPEDEIDKVTSPKGCTIAGLNEMEHNGFSSSFIKGITISAKQAKGLYTEE